MNSFLLRKWLIHKNLNFKQVGRVGLFGISKMSALTLQDINELLY